MHIGLQPLRGGKHTSPGRTSLTRPRATSWAKATQSNVAWRARAGAMGGGTAASLRGRRIRVITDAWGRAAMRRSAPRRHKGQVAIARSNTRRSSLAQLQRGVPVLASGPSTPCWRGVGVIAPRQLLCGAKQPPYRTRWTRGSGTSAASLSNSSRGESVTPVIPRRLQLKGSSSSFWHVSQPSRRKP